MKPKQDQVVLTQEELLELQNANGGGDGGQKEDLEEETKTGQDEEEVADDTGLADEEDGEHLDWKEARSILKQADESVSHSIDDFEQRSVINSLKIRFNAKERSVRLHESILSL